jgi:hypothetical protein
MGKTRLKYCPVWDRNRNILREFPILSICLKVAAAKGRSVGEEIRNQSAPPTKMRVGHSADEGMEKKDDRAKGRRYVPM